MKNLLRPGLAKKVILFAFILGLVSPSAFAYTDVAPSFVNNNQLVAINPNVIKQVNPGLVAAVSPQVNALGVTTVTGAATVYFNLNAPARTTVWIKDSTDTIVKTLLFDTDLQANQTYQYTWDGTNNSNTAVASGNYKAQVVAYNSADTAVQNYNFSFTATSNVPPATAPVLSNVYASPSPFDPNTTNTRVYFTVDKAATGTVTILNGSTIIRTLVSSTSLTAGSYYYEWNGRDNGGSIVANGTYTANVNVSNGSGADTKTASVQVSTSGSTSCNNLVTSHYASPSTFNPNDTTTQIYFNLSRSANVTVRILKNGAVTKTLLNNQSLSSGSNSTYWNGRDDSGNFVNNGTYTYEIRSSVSGCADEVDSSNVYVSNSTGSNGYVDDWPSTNENLVTNLQVVPEIFNPQNGDRANITFYLQNTAKLKVEVLNGTTVVKTLKDSSGSRVSSGNYSYFWDGRDNNGYRVNDAVFQVRVMADDGSNTDTDRAYVEVDTDGVIIGFPSSAQCAGFRDVSTNSPFCKAIQLMSKKNIFDGYSDGTFRPYQKINRAETAKVVVLAMGYDVPTSGYFGKQYTDTVANAWYSPFLDVARRNNIATGYPDGSFRPANTINRVELLRVFLEANSITGSNCSPAPFEDTPITPDTNWYMKYACYAKQNGLMNSDTSTKLYPADAMTRGDVADLFYDFEVKGLYNNYNGNGYNNNNCGQYDYNCRLNNASNTNCYYNSNGNYVCDNYNNNNSCYYNSNGNYVCNNYNNNNCYYSSNGTYTCNSSYNPANQVCVARDVNGHCTSWAYDNGNVNYSNNTSNGYYVYQNGQYVWVSY